MWKLDGMALAGLGAFLVMSITLAINQKIERQTSVKIG